MENFGGSGMVVVGNGAKKRRSDASRRPRHDSHTLLRSNISLAAPTQLISNEQTQNNVDKLVVPDGLRSENKLKKLKLKVGGVTRTIHTKPTTDFASESGSSATFKLPEKPLLQDETDWNNSCNFSDKRKGLGVKFKSIPKTDSTFHFEHVRKSNRVPKRRVLDIGFDEDGNKDEEIRYLERLNTPRTPGEIEDGKDCRSKSERVTFKAPKSRVVSDVLYGDAVGNGSSRLRKDCKKKSRSEKEYEDIDYISDEEYRSSRKKMKKESQNLYADGWNESTPSTRNRSMHSVSSSIDLPNLLSSNSKRKKEELSEVDQQLKKAEAAQRRKMQSEKAAREAEAEAIRKILGQDSGRKKREEKMKKQRDELLQEKASNARTLAANTVRWVNSSTGTIITFSKDIGLPSIFKAVPCCYPAAREKCAGPNCTNAYKYRDAKSNLPLCSLQCYKSVNRNVEPLVTC